MEKVKWFDKAIYFSDITDQLFNEMVEYCETNNLKLIHYGNEDVSDVSYQFDTVAVFRFENDEDAILFRLRYGGKS